MVLSTHVFGASNRLARMRRASSSDVLDLRRTDPHASRPDPLGEEDLATPFDHLESGGLTESCNVSLVHRSELSHAELETLRKYLAANIQDLPQASLLSHLNAKVENRRPAKPGSPSAEAEAAALEDEAEWGASDDQELAQKVLHWLTVATQLGGGAQLRDL
jgi:hypothetical protein